MSDPDVAALRSLPWPAMNHHAARSWLERRGWRKCGEGDWANVFRSPAGALAARVSAFEPSYQWFVELCQRAAGNPYLPRIDLVAELEGGGHLAVLEFLTPVGSDDERQFLEDWKARSEPELRQLRTHLEALDKECREKVPFWMGIDLGDHVMRGADGHVKLIDLLGVAGGPICAQIHADMETFLQLIPRDRCQYMLDIPHFSRSYARQERARLAAEFAAYDRNHR